MKRVTLKDVAKTAGVSYATVSRALSGSNQIGQATRERIVRLCEEMGYTGNYVARSMVKKKTDLIGLVVPAIENEFMSQLAYYAEMSARSHGYNIMLCDSGPDLRQEINVVKLLLVGIIAAATMVIPGVSGSMMLMLLGYYDTILKTINNFMDALVAFDIQDLLVQCGILIPFGIGVILGIFLIAKIIEFIFSKAEIHAYYAIIGLILASPIAILLKTDWSGFSILTLVIGLVTFAAGWFVSSKLGGE